MYSYLILPLLAVITQSAYGYSQISPLSILHKLIAGEVLPCCGPRYEALRLVNNKACVARPAVVVRPSNTEDVAVVVNFARRNGYEISVRSGGHGYTCNNLKERGIHIDMRGLNTIQKVKSSRSSTGIAAVLGTGSTWGQIQRRIPLTKYSYPHGQCRSVGVGGYLMGGGVNWLGTYNKYGYAAEHVLRMRVVTANGTILDLEPGVTTLHPKYPHEKKVVMKNEYNNDLFFAMRGAGSSYGIATEVLYQIYRQPETQPAVILVWINDMKDLWRIQAAAQDSYMYSIAIQNEYAGDFWNAPKTRLVYKFLPALLTSMKLIHRQGASAAFLTVTDIRQGAGYLTDPIAALNYLRSEGVDVIHTSPVLVRIFDNFGRYLYDMNIDEQENQPAGEYHLAGVNLGGMKDTSALQEVFFNNPSFGVLRTNNHMFRTIGCNYCFWSIHFRNRQQFLSKRSHNLKISTNTDNDIKHGVDSNLVCLFKDPKSQCPREIIKIKKQMENTLNMYNKSYSKYYNYPSCDSEDWMFRYWGDNYNRLLAIKEYWDPENLFNHCQSVGSTDNSCCPFTASGKNYHN